MLGVADFRKEFCGLAVFVKLGQARGERRVFHAPLAVVAEAGKEFGGGLRQRTFGETSQGGGDALSDVEGGGHGVRIS